MKLHHLIIIIALLTLAASCKDPEPKVMARFVPERADDFVFENNLVAGRFYGEALEGNPTSPGIDIWVKIPGALVANDWYAHAVEDPGFYHHDHGGKDCYKVAVSLGGGASVPLVDSVLAFPATNYRSYEILEEGPDKVVFVLSYPAWSVGEGISVSLDKKITVVPDTYFIEAEDTYNFTGVDSLTIAAGIKLHGEQATIVESYSAPDRYAIWEHASDQSAEPEDGLIGVAVAMPGADGISVREDLDHALVLKKIASGEPLRYFFGSCWSKGFVSDADSWFDLVSGVAAK